MKLNLIISAKNKQLQKYINQLTENWSLLENMISNICLLCGVHNFSDRIPINLIYGQDNKKVFAWFSWTPNKSTITVEFNKPPKTDNQFVMMVLAHELFHLILRKNKKLIQKLSQYTESNKSVFTKIKEKKLLPRIILEELIISSFIPEGYLSKIYFNKPIKKVSSKFSHNDLIDWRRYAAHKMQQHAQLYFKKKQAIDDAYIKKIISIVQNL